MAGANAAPADLFSFSQARPSAKEMVLTQGGRKMKIRWNDLTKFCPDQRVSLWEIEFPPRFSR